MNNFESDFLSKKLLIPEKLEEYTADLKKQNKKIVTLNGSFDLLHAGHLHIIYEASLCGDVLLVALNSDASIQKYKDPSRPIIPLKYRLQMMAALQFVDYVTWFEETDPRALLEKVRPTIHINGIEYGKDCLEADIVRKYGGEVKTISIIEGLSTSNIIKRIKQSCAS